MLVSVVVRTFGWVVLLGQRGVVNQLLALVGVTHPIGFLYTPAAVTLALAQAFLPFMILSITASLSSIDRTLEEAAATLGADGLHTFRAVTFPLSLPGVASGCVLVFSLSIGSYIAPQMVGGGRVLTVTTLIYQRMEQAFDWRSGSAMAVILMAVVLGAILLSFALLARSQRWRNSRAT
jgi:putative spermidine/putrescine transport system permease protein